MMFVYVVYLSKLKFIYARLRRAIGKGVSSLYLVCEGLAQMMVYVGLGPMISLIEV